MHMAETGTYILILYLPENTRLTLDSGETYDFPAGYYAYVGSASASEGLAERIKYHLSPVESPDSALDYLQQVTHVEEIWLSSSPVSRKHAWADLLIGIPGSLTIIEDFETEDCDCDTHLFYFEVRPMLEDFAVGVRQLFPEDIVLRAFSRGKNGQEEGA